MTPDQLKGALLEYLVRRLLTNCGFASVKPDGLYIYKQAGTGLFCVNGKGAAHDADVLMEPPIQMPFSYPYRILFECKAHGRNVGLTVVRNALGLRLDINEFEIVTKASLQQRQNNRRANFAIEDRKRFNYQVGVAAVGNFSKSAIEFAANNKIPLLSLKLFMDDITCELIHAIDKSYLSGISTSLQGKIYSYLKDKKHDAEYAGRNQEARTFIQNDTLIGKIIRFFNTVINDSYVGLTETGDLIFLFANHPNSSELLRAIGRFNGLRAQIHYYPDNPNVWLLEIISDESHRDRNPEFKFFVPERIMIRWRLFNLDRAVAIDLKQEFFSRIFIFTKPIENKLPFFVVNIDRDWLNEIRNIDA